MVILAISGSGIGAGKTTLARRYSPHIWSLAGALRQELSIMYPNYDWFNKTQEYKDFTKVKERDNVTVRQVLIAHGQLRCEEDPLYWVRTMSDKLKGTIHLMGAGTVLPIDDVRKVSEVLYMREIFGKDFLHYHVSNPLAKPEPEFEADKLERLADYIIYPNYVNEKK